MSQRRVERVIKGVPTSDGAGVRMTRVIASPELDMFDPFLLLDEFRSDDPDDYIAGFPDHPHRGFETVTYMLAGAMEHRDNQGNSGLLTAGSVQWMTAGRGIVHSEMPQQENGLMWGFQLWVNLPAADKMTKPRYQDIAPAEVPEVDLGRGVTARVVAGSLGAATGPVSGIATRPLFFDVSIPADGDVELPLPEGHSAFIYTYEGELSVGDETIGLKEIGLLSRSGNVSVRANADDTRCLLIAGRPLEEPVARYGPFVMNTDQELRQAFLDFQNGRF